MKQFGKSTNVWLIIIIGLLFLGFLSTMPYSPMESFNTKGQFRVGRFNLLTLMKNSWWNNKDAAKKAAIEYAKNNDVGSSGGPFFAIKALGKSGYVNEEDRYMAVYRPVLCRDKSCVPKLEYVKGRVECQEGSRDCWAYDVKDKLTSHKPQTKSHKPKAKSHKPEPSVKGPPKSLRKLPGVGESPKGCYWKASGNKSKCTKKGRTVFNNWITNENFHPKHRTIDGCRNRAIDVAKYCRGKTRGSKYKPIEGQDYEIYFAKK